MILTTLTETLTLEAAALVGAVSVTTLARLLGAIGIATLLIVGTDVILRQTRQLGLDPRQRIGSVRLLVRTAILSWFLVGLARALIAVAPVLTAVAAAMSVALLALLLLRRLPGLIAGLWLSLRGKLHEGDRISVGELQGTVERLGPFECTLRRDDGALVVTATHRLTTDHLVITAKGAAEMLEVDFPPGVDPELARRRATLSAYRVPRTPVTSLPEASGSARVRLFVWAGASRAAAAALSRP